MGHGLTLAAKVGRDLHRTPRHPLNTIKRIIEAHFNEATGSGTAPPFAYLPPPASGPAATGMADLAAQQPAPRRATA